MAMGARIPMPTDTEQLTLAQWFSASYPVGAFAYSHGLEAAIAVGDVTDATTLRAWVEGVLTQGSGRTDAIALAAAYAAQEAAEVRAIDAEVRAFAPSAERAMETDLLGAAFCEITGRVWDMELSGLSYPVAAGRAARLAGFDRAMTAQMFLHSFVTSLVSVGMRLIPLGQTDGHVIIHALAPLCAEIAQETTSGDLDDMASTAFLGDIASMQHETQYARVFRT